jgi:hypothetical protein
MIGSRGGRDSKEPEMKNWTPITTIVLGSFQDLWANCPDTLGLKAVKG